MSSVGVSSTFCEILMLRRICLWTGNARAIEALEKSDQSCASLRSVWECSPEIRKCTPLAWNNGDLAGSLECWVAPSGDAMARSTPWWKRLQDPRDVRAAALFATLLLIGDALLSYIIIARVPCTWAVACHFRMTSTPGAQWTLPLDQPWSMMNTCRHRD